MPECSNTPPPSSNRTCGFPASGSHASIPRNDLQPPQQVCYRLREESHGRHNCHPPSLRRGICIQAEFLSSSHSSLTFRPLRSTVITRFLATMSLSDSRSQPPCGYVFPHTVGGSPTTEPGLPGSLADLSTRAVPFHPGEPDECTHPLLHRQWQASASLADWPLPISVTRPIRVRLRYGSRVCRTRLRTANCSTPALVWLPVVRVIYRMNSFQFTRSARLGLAHRRTQRNPSQ